MARHFHLREHKGALGKILIRENLGPPSLAHNSASTEPRANTTTPPYHLPLTRAVDPGTARPSVQYKVAQGRPEGSIQALGIPSSVSICLQGS